MTAATKPASDLVPGDRYLRTGDGDAADVTVRILGPQEPDPNRFDLPWFRYWAMREDTGQTGFVGFGPTGIVTLVPDDIDSAAASGSGPVRRAHPRRRAVHRSARVNASGSRQAVTAAAIQASCPQLPAHIAADLARVEQIAARPDAVQHTDDGFAFFNTDVVTSRELSFVSGVYQAAYAHGWNPTDA